MQLPFPCTLLTIHHPSTTPCVHAGGPFDPLGLASGDAEKAFNLKTAEIKHGRLAMVAFLGFGVQALTTGLGVLGSLAKFAEAL
jgi:light-harvesting complex II chlorophyll a/b binding protein 4